MKRPSKWLIAAFVGVAGMAGFVGSSARAAIVLTAEASVTPHAQFVGGLGVIYVFTVRNTSPSANVSAVQILSPNRTFLVDCLAAPSGWTARRASGGCMFASAVGTGDDLTPGASSSAFVARGRVGR